jgi:hypothetical protein
MLLSLFSFILLIRWGPHSRGSAHRGHQLHHPFRLGVEVNEDVRPAAIKSTVGDRGVPITVNGGV